MIAVNISDSSKATAPKVLIFLQIMHYAKNNHHRKKRMHFNLTEHVLAWTPSNINIKNNVLSNI